MNSNMMRHTDIVQVPAGRPAGRWPAAYGDDALRRIAAFRVVMGAAASNATAALHGGMAWHGRPASIMADRGSRFPANEAEGAGAWGGWGGVGWWQPSRPGPCAQTRGTSRPRSPVPGRTAGSRGSTGRSGAARASSRRSRRGRRPCPTCPGDASQWAGVPPRRPAGRHAAWRGRGARRGLRPPDAPGA